MKYIVNKKILKYLLLLCSLFIASALLILGTHVIFTRMNTKHTHNEETLSERLLYLKQIDSALFKLESYVYASTAATNNPQERDALYVRILEENKAIVQLLDAFNQQNEHLLSIKDMEGAQCKHKAKHLTKGLKTNVAYVLEQISVLHTLLNERDMFIRTQDAKLQSIAKRIRTINKMMPHYLEDSHKLIQSVYDYSKERMEVIKQITQKAQKHYFFAEVFLNILYAMGLFYLLYRIFQNIISLYQTLERQLHQDQLTKLPNRFSLLKKIETLKEPMLGIVDINQFHLINELYGADVGNNVLLLLSKRLAYVSQDKPFTLYRTSGDEFVFLNEDKNITTFASMLEECIKTVEKEPLHLSSIKDSISLSFSCGIAASNTNVLGYADMALNRAKRLKTTAIAIYDETLDSIDSLECTKKWKSAIEKGLEENGFIPHFQPILDANGSIVKHEALMRLCLHEESKTTIVSPSQFLDLSKKMRTYHQVSTMMLLKTLDIAISHKRPLSLNLCYQDIINQPLTLALKQTIEHHSIGEYLTFEIIESEDIEDYTVVQTFMETFKALGVRMALDDFGSGFSNFNHILMLSPDYIKIDGSLIKDIHHNTKSKEMVKAICSFSKSLGIKTVAEYVHNKEVYEIVKAIGVDYFQGYYFAEPAPFIKEIL